MEVRNFWVDIEDSSGNRYGSGPVRALRFTRRSPLSASGEFSFPVAAADPNVAVLQLKRVAICRYIDSAGAIQVFGGGVIDKIVAAVDETGLMVLEVSGNDLTRELTYRSVGSLQLAVDSAGVVDGPEQIIAFAPSGWTLSGDDTETPVYAGFDGESVLAALCKAGEHIGEHWTLGAGRVVTWLGPADGFAASGVRAVQHVNDPVAAETATDIVVISSLEVEADAAEICTRIIPRGSGNGSAIVTLAAATDSAPAGYTLDKANNYLRLDAAETSYGQIERVIDFKELGPLSNTTLDVQNAANMLLQASAEYLRIYGSPKEFYKLGLAVTGVLLEPGTTIYVVYRQLVDGVVIYDLDDVFNILEVENALDATGLHTQGILISNIDRQPVSDAEFLTGEAQNSRVFAAHQQLGASVDNITWRDELDADHDASLRFWLGDEYTVIQRAVLRFRIQPLRSTVKSVGASSATTSSGGSSTPTSASGGAHGHNLHIYAYSGAGQPVQVLGGYLQTGDASTDDVQTSAATPSDHTHNVSISAHTHDVTPTINTSYGIFEESSGNTLALANLVIKLNGGSDLVGSVSDIGNGWLQLDITGGLVSAIFRPVQENNELVISTAVAKTARIEAQLTIRGVVQAVAYS